MAVPDEIKRLEYLSLVSKVCTELENHLDISEKCLGKVTQRVSILYLYSELKGCYKSISDTKYDYIKYIPSCDKSLFQFYWFWLIAAEFIIHLAEKHPTFEEFKAALRENGADFTVLTQLLTQLHILICVSLFCPLTPISVFRILLLTICSGLLIPCDLHHQQVKVLNFKILYNIAEYHCFNVCFLLCSVWQPVSQRSSQRMRRTSWKRNILRYANQMLLCGR